MHYFELVRDASLTFKTHIFSQVMMPCEYQQFRGTYCLNLQGRRRPSKVLFIMWEMF
jgi:hypothetical protein